MALIPLNLPAIKDFSDAQLQTLPAGTWIEGVPCHLGSWPSTNAENIINRDRGIALKASHGLKIAMPIRFEIVASGATGTSDMGGFQRQMNAVSSRTEHAQRHQDWSAAGFTVFDATWISPAMLPGGEFSLIYYVIDWGNETLMRQSAVARVDQLCYQKWALGRIERFYDWIEADGLYNGWKASVFGNPTEMICVPGGWYDAINDTTTPDNYDISTIMVTPFQGPEFDCEFHQGMRDFLTALDRPFITEFNARLPHPGTITMPEFIASMEASLGSALVASGLWIGEAESGTLGPN